MVLDGRVGRVELHLGGLVLNSLGVCALDQVVSSERDARFDDSSFGSDGSLGTLLHDNDVAGGDSINHLEELDSVLARVTELFVGGLNAIFVFHDKGNRDVRLEVLAVVGEQSSSELSSSRVSRDRAGGPVCGLRFRGGVEKVQNEFASIDLFDGNFGFFLDDGLVDVQLLDFLGAVVVGAVSGFLSDEDAVLIKASLHVV